MTNSQLPGSVAKPASAPKENRFEGFFVDPVLTGLSVGPQSPNIQQGTTLEMSAIGTDDDGRTKTLTSNVFWSSSNTSVAPLTSGGRVTGASSGTSTITASSGAASGTFTRGFAEQCDWNYAAAKLTDDRLGTKRNEYGARNGFRRIHDGRRNCNHDLGCHHEYRLPRAEYQHHQSAIARYG